MYCPKCGKENSEDAKFCMHCGADLSEYKVEISPKIEVSPKIDVSLDIEKLRDLKIPDKEEAIVEIVKEFNETLRTIGIPASFDSEKSLDLTPFQKEVAKTVEDKVDEVLDKFKKPTGDPTTYIRLGTFEGYLENYEKAIDYCKKAIELDFNSIAAWAVMADCYDRMGEHEKALKCYDAVSKIKPPKMDKKEFDSNTLLAWAVKGYRFGEIGEYEKALECFDKILEINPNFPVWDRKGFTLGKLGKHEEAIRCFDKALEINPKHVLVWISKGFVLDELGKHEEAIECFDKALEINPNDADVWKAKGNSLHLLLVKYKESEHTDNLKERIYVFKELLERALASFKRAVELNPNDDSARDEINKIQKTLLALSQYNSRKKGALEEIAELLHEKWYDDLSKEDLVDFLKKLPKEIGESYEKFSKGKSKGWFLKWLIDYVIPPLEDYYHSKKGCYCHLNNATLGKLIKDVVDDEDQKEELLEMLHYIDKDERIELLKDLAKRLLEKE